MLIKTFSFNRVQKTVNAIEAQLNEFLKDNSLKFATQNESTVKGKFIISLFYEPKKGNIKAKIFKSQLIEQIDTNVNQFLEQVDMKLVTQTFVGSSIYTTIFYTGEYKAPVIPVEEQKTIIDPTTDEELEDEE